MTQYIYGKNVVRSLLQDKKKIYEVVMVDGVKDATIEKLLKEQRVPVRIVGRKKLEQLLPASVVHQGIAAKIDDYKTYELEELIASVPSEKQPLFVMLDGLEDPHNLGAILRTCDCVGVDGVIIGKHRNVKLTPTVAKVSTGAIDTVKVSMVTNLSQALKFLKKQGFWVVGADLTNAIDYRSAQYDVPLVVVIGSEGFGISPLVTKNCDYCVKLPMEGSVSSLNASVACGILLYQIYNSRNPL